MSSFSLNRMKPKNTNDRLKLVQIPLGYGEIDIQMYGIKYRITEDFEGFMKIHRRDGEKILVSPCVANEILIK